MNECVNSGLLVKGRFKFW